MRKKSRRLLKKGNVIVFPGTFEQLINKGITYTNEAQYEKAIELFEQALQFDPNHHDFYGPFAVALYESKEFARAKEIVGKILQNGPSNYLDTIELYLAISIQLQEYEEVEQTIQALMEENIIPNDSLTKFNYLRELNTRMLERTKSDGQVHVETRSAFTYEEFIEMDTMTQQYSLSTLEGHELISVLPTIVEIAEDHSLSPLVITFALTLLQQAQYNREVTVTKFGASKTFIPAFIPPPGQDEKTLDVLNLLDKHYSKDPSRFDIAQNLIEKFIITAYPLNWGDYQTDEIAEAYIIYIEGMFSGEEMGKSPLLDFIKDIDLESSLGKE